MDRKITNQAKIRHLQLYEIPIFAKLRNKISDEAEHVIAKRGERKDIGVLILAQILLSKRRTHTFLAWDRSKAVGYVSIIFAKFRKFQGNAYLTIAVSASHRNQGIGSQLMDTAESFAKSLGKRRMELEVFGKNTKAIGLYKKRGYIIEGIKKNAVLDDNGFDDVIIMTKTL